MLLMLNLLVLSCSAVYAMDAQQEQQSYEQIEIVDDGNEGQETPLLISTQNTTTKKKKNIVTENKQEEVATENTTTTETAENTTKSETSKLYDIAQKEKKSLEDYQQAYGNNSYGLAAYILHMVQIYSIPFCFVGFAIAAIYQYVLGIRKLDTRDKGFAIMISIMTVFVIAQVLPLVFALVVKGWGN